MPKWINHKIGSKVEGVSIIACPKCGKACVRGSRIPSRQGGFIQSYYHETKITYAAGMAFNHVKQHCAIIES